MAHNEFKFLTVTCTLSVELTNTPGTAKVNSSNVTRATCFFFQTVSFPVQRISAFYLSAYVLPDLKIVYFCCKTFSLLLFAVFLHFKNLPESKFLLNLLDFVKVSFFSKYFCFGLIGFGFFLSDVLAPYCVLW